MFIAPAVLFCGFFLWLWGEPLDAIQSVDRFVLKAIRVAGAACRAAIEAFANL
jgi:hypothetical protein